MSHIINNVTAKDSGHKQRPELNFAIGCLHQKSCWFSRNPPHPLGISLFSPRYLNPLRGTYTPLTQNAEFNPSAVV